MKKYFALFFFLNILFNPNSNAQFSRYIIRLKDKNINTYSIANPSQYLTARALQRRTRYSIAIDSFDLPVTQRYIDSIRLAGSVIILNVSKWLNQVAIQTSDAAALAKINAFSFVLNTNAIAAKPQQINSSINNKLDLSKLSSPPPFSAENILGNFYNYGASYSQIHIHNGEFLHNHGFKGDGMQLAILDAGFLNYLTLHTFDSVRNNNQILGTWDFVANETSVNEDHPHGTECFSEIAANMPNTFVGSAPKTNFYLFRTEDAATEYPIEEQNWLAAAERADSLGVDIISSSLGYNTFDNAIFNHTYTDLNGSTTISAKAANFATKKGMLVFAAAGNSGSSTWHYIDTPADADSIVSVGAVDTTRIIGEFSGYGPNSSGQIKPEISSVGVAGVCANPNTGLPIFGNGTSFSCPNIAGLTICLWQAFPEINCRGIIKALEQSSNQFLNPDNRLGYGIPDMKKAFVILEKQFFKKQIRQSNCQTNLQWSIKTDSTITVSVERKLATENNYSIVNTQTSTGGFMLRNFVFLDNLSALNSQLINYRIKIIVGSDTSFYADSLSVNFLAKPNLGVDISKVKCVDSSINLNAIFSTSGLTFAWTLNGIAVANPSSISTAGTYQLVASNNFGCADTALAIITNNSNYCPIVSEKNSVSPNPVSDYLNISIIKIASVNAEIIIYNSLGQKVYYLQNKQLAGGQIYHINTKQFATGLYFVNIIINGQKSLIKKFMKI